MTTSAIWISYDLGVRGDYASLYTWLDSHSAKECGDSLAFLNYEHQGNLKDELKTELKGALTVEQRTRVYVIYRDPTTGKNKGSFLFGGRKAPPWSGYSTKGVGATDEEGN